MGRPQAAPLSEAEISQFIDAELLPLLKIMMLADNDGWSLFDHPVREQQRRETLAVFEIVEKLIYPGTTSEIGPPQSLKNGSCIHPILPL